MGRRESEAERWDQGLGSALDLHLSLLPQLAQEARSIYQEFLSSQALSPVNIDRQAWLGEEVLANPRPDMFRAQQLQVRGRGFGRSTGAEAGPDPGAEPEPLWAGNEGWGGEGANSVEGLETSK